MKEYSCSEIGMLTGVVIGGGLAVVGFLIARNAWFFVIAGVGMAAGTVLGGMLDRRKLQQHNKEGNI